MFGLSIAGESFHHMFLCLPRRYLNVLQKHFWRLLGSISVLFSWVSEAWWLDCVKGWERAGTKRFFCFFHLKFLVYVPSVIRSRDVQS